VNWLEASGARSIAIPFNADNNEYGDGDNSNGMDEEEISNTFHHTDGFLFPGGMHYMDMPNSTTRLLYKLAKEANDQGDRFPVWGTCLGFGYLVMLEASEDLYEQTHNALDTNYDAQNIYLALEYTHEAANSTMYGDKTILNMAGELPFSMNMHNNDITPDSFSLKNERLSSMYKVLSTNVDLNGRPFVSSMEARDYPFLAPSSIQKRTCLST
jgi:gamma-glutamyl hydrolase